MEAYDRIIPARAGFTRQRPRHQPHEADHPRSRGVYRRARSASSWSSGSSPLARGLLRQVGQRAQAAGSSPLARGLRDPDVRFGRERGIIPARAGFTAGQFGVAVRAGDHPRSRGVYTNPKGARYCREGSSPLARGLRLEPVLRVVMGGIIPARAGFTYVTLIFSRAPADHLRSRGVYRSESNDMVEMLDNTRSRGVYRRDSHDLVELLDHPRSRGVYAPSRCTRTAPAGSSPLARGLHQPRTVEGRGVGIIPARAGFTMSSLQKARTEEGSSPLARGLPREGGDGSGDARIIPARAGFTRLLHRVAEPRQDHPRSRGVYPCVHGGAGLIGGSSPLARGLRVDAGVVVQAPGIIPARAGFTDPALGRARRREDHPRSRGVYCPTAARRVRMSGSSPLARGLPAAGAGSAGGSGIIPARAGFTRVRVRVAGGAADHPRSRGVYAAGCTWADIPPGSSPRARG